MQPRSIAASSKPLIDRISGRRRGWWTPSAIGKTVSGSRAVFVDWEEAKASINQVWKGIPNLCVELHDVLATEDVVLARGTVRGTAKGRLYSAPATERSFEASFFDYVRLDDGLIVERVQQADALGQMRQLYGRAMDLVGLAAMLWRL